MSETTGFDRLVELSPRMYRALMTRRGRFLSIAAAVFLVLGVAIGGHIYGRVLAFHTILARDNTIQQVRAESQKLKAEINDQAVKLTALQDKLTKVQAALDAILPSENTYNIVPNQSLIVADGHLTVGLIGSPANQGININVNGKPQFAAAGEVINVAVDPSTSCQLTVQSFDMFKAVVNASCAAAKPKQ